MGLDTVQGFGLGRACLGFIERKATDLGLIGFRVFSRRGTLENLGVCRGSHADYGRPFADYVGEDMLEKHPWLHDSAWRAPTLKS